MIYNGDNGEIELLEDHLILRRRGVQGRLAFGKDVPERKIPLQAIYDVRYKPAGRIGNGWLRLVLGADDAPADFKPKNDDIDTVTFVPKHKDTWDQLHGYLQNVAAQNQSAGIETGSIDYDQGHNATDRRNEKQQAAAEGQQLKAQEKAREVEAKFLAEGVRADIASAVGRMGTTFGGKREVRRLEQLMYDGEQVRELATGKVGDKVGIVGSVTLR